MTQTKVSTKDLRDAVYRNVYSRPENRQKALEAIAKLQASIDRKQADIDVIRLAMEGVAGEG